jgi:hypothetical protein
VSRVGWGDWNSLASDRSAEMEPARTYAINASGRTNALNLHQIQANGASAKGPSNGLGSTKAGSSRVKQMWWGRSQTM